MIYTISHLVTGSLFWSTSSGKCTLWSAFNLRSAVQGRNGGLPWRFFTATVRGNGRSLGKKKKKKTPGGQREDTSTRRPPSKQTSKNAAMKWWNALNLCLQSVSTSLWTWLCPEARSGNLLLWISSHPTKMPGRLFGCARWNAQFKPRLWVILQR